MSQKMRIFLIPLNRALLNLGGKSFHRWVAPTLKALYKRKKEMGPQPPAKRSNFIEWNYDAELFAFGKRLGEEWDEALLRQALTEKSYIAQEEENLRKVGVEANLELTDNEKLASDGGVFIYDYCQQYIGTLLPRLPQPHRRAIEDDLLNEKQLSQISSGIGINDLVLSAEHPPSEETLSRSFKAVTEALGLSSGRDRAGGFIRDLVLVHLSGKDLTPFCTPQQPLQILQETLKDKTESRLIAASGRHSVLANYQVGIYVNRKLVGRGCGESANIAEEMAALDGLWRLWGVPTNRRPFVFNLELPPSQLEAR